MRLKRLITLKNKPKDWRNGQAIFNFLEWLSYRGYPTSQSSRIADTFHILDSELDDLWEVYIKERNKLYGKGK